MLSKACSGAETVHLEEAVGEDPGEGGCHTSDEIEDSITLLELVARIPTAEEISTAWEETCFENAEDDSEPDHRCPDFDKAEANRESAPCKRDAGQKDTRAYLTHDHRRGRLKKDVGDEAAFRERRIKSVVNGGTYKTHTMIE